MSCGGVEGYSVDLKGSERAVFSFRRNQKSLLNYVIIGNNV